jgi:hypothetical protein
VGVRCYKLAARHLHSLRQPLLASSMSLGVRSLLSGLAQGSFHRSVDMAPDLSQAHIAIPSKDGRWFVMFKNAQTLLILKQSHA